MIPGLVTVVVVAVAAIVGTRLLLPRVIHHFIYFPERLSEDAASPDAWGFPEAEEVRFASEDGVRLHGWWFPPSGTEGIVRRDDAHIHGPDPAAAIYLHGNAGNVVTRGDIARALSRWGIGVLLFDYRGYGASDGSPDESGIYADATAALRHVVEVRRIPAMRTVLFGNSLGAAVGVELASRENVAGLIMLGSLPGTVPVARALHPYLPSAMLDWKTHRFDALGRIGSIESPVLLAHGTHDRVIRPRLARRLYDAAPEPKRWYEAPGFGHDDILADPGLWREIELFLEEVLPR